MSRPYWRVKHVGTLSQLPDKLTRGRAYFVDDEQVIIIDHGRGPVTYGGKPGPQGQAGEPLPRLQDQIDKLSEAELYTQETLWYLTQRMDEKFETAAGRISDLSEHHESDMEAAQARITQEAALAKDYTDQLAAQTAEHEAAITARQESDLEHLHELIDRTDSRLQSQADHHTEAILSLISTIQEKFTSYDNALAIITKSIASLYPAPYAEEKPEDPLDGETLTTDAGTWKIEQTYLSDGTILLELDAEELLIDTLQVGDKVDYDGSTWKVQSKEVQDGMIVLTLEP